MSDREESAERQENGSHRSVEESAHSASPHASESPRRSRSRSRSPRQRSRSPRKRSHSRSRSRTRRYSRHRREHSKSRSRSPRSRRYPRDRRSPYETFERKSSRHSGGYYSDYRNRGDGYHREHSRSPMSSRRRHVGNRENPPQGRCLGIFGLSIYTQERDLKDVFSKYGPIEDVQIVYDAQSGRSRGFAFVYYECSDDAKLAKDRCNGIEIDGRKIRVDFSITQRAHTPTPGIYMGKPTYAPRYRGGGGGGGGSGSGGGGGGRYGGGYDRSPSPYYAREKRRYSRSRSRSHSPRKYHYY